MFKHTKTLIRASLLVLLIFPFCMGDMRAGEYHTVDQNTCADCHTSHASVRGQTWTPTRHMLRSSEGEVGLCMSCHDGTDGRSPDIVGSGTSSSPSDVVTTPYLSKFGSSAGFFQTDHLLAPSDYGHDLGPTGAGPAPLSNTYSTSEGMKCSDCHDPHGNGNYRNLLPDPNPNHVGSVTLAIGDQVREATPVNVQAPNPDVAYDTGNVSFSVQNNIGKWCTDCHDQLATNSTGNSPAHFRGHPSDVAIGGIDAHTNTANWTAPGSQSTTGFGTNIGDASPGIPRLRFGSPTGSNKVAGNGDTVMCLSCHKAHGSKHKKAMVWPFHQPGADMFSGCQQCHFK